MKVTTFGESHGAAIGAVIDGCPAGIPLSVEDIAADLAAARPAGTFETARREVNTPEILSGVFEGSTLGTPIAVLIRNADARPHDYEALKHVYRPGHADFAYEAKYRRRDWRGGGRASGREAAARIAAGTVAKKILGRYAAVCSGSTGIAVPQCSSAAADAVSVVPHSFHRFALRLHAAEAGIQHIDVSMTESPIGISLGAVEIAGIPCDPPVGRTDELPAVIRDRLVQLKAAGDSAGAVIECRICNVPAGLGEPVFDKLEAELAKAVLSIGSVKGISFGAGFQLARMTGSEANAAGKNHHGGIVGGISDGNDIVFQAVVKPVPSIGQEQLMLSSTGEYVRYAIHGRHDVCLYRRIMPVIEAMSALVLADMLLRQRACLS